MIFVSESFERVIRPNGNMIEIETETKAATEKQTVVAAVSYHVLKPWYRMQVRSEHLTDQVSFLTSPPKAVVSRGTHCG
jgi:hypothetical protein